MNELPLTLGAMVATYCRLVEGPFLRVMVTGSSSWPPAHFRVKGTPAWTAEGGLVNLILDWAKAAPRKLAPTSRMLANCMITIVSRVFARDGC